MCFHASDKAKANDGVWLGHFRTRGKRLSEFNLLDFVLPGKRAPALQKGGVPMILNLIFRLVYPVAYFFSQFATRKFYGVSRTKRPTEMRFCSGDVCRIGSPRTVIFKVCNRHGGKSEQSHHSPSCFFLLLSSKPDNEIHGLFRFPFWSRNYFSFFPEQVDALFESPLPRHFQSGDGKIAPDQIYECFFILQTDQVNTHE